MIFGSEGIRRSIRKAYAKHLRMYEQDPSLAELGPHHSALHGALVLRYAFSSRFIPEAIVLLELSPLLTLDPEEGVEALAEYVVFKERRTASDRDSVQEWFRAGLARMDPVEREWCLQQAQEYGFAWLRLLGDEAITQRINDEGAESGKK